MLGRSLTPLSRSLGSKDAATRERSCKRILELLDSLGPRTVSWTWPTEPCLIFTDAAFERGVATLGAIFIDAAHNCAEVYDGEVPQPLAD